MNRATPELRALAGRLVAFEAGGPGSSRKQAATAFPVTGKLRLHLTPLMGSDGYRALLKRALALAGAEVAWLRTLRVAADGTLEDSDEPAPPVAPEQRLEGKVVLVAQLLGLLVAFIGENLMGRLLREIWPRLPLGKQKSSKQNKHENQP